MTKEEYHQLLKDGRWQRRRLEIMQRDDFKCRDCGTTDDLNVHHIRYLAGRKPWEYDDGDLITLCGKCHKKWHEEIEGMHYDCAKCQHFHQQYIFGDSERQIFEYDGLCKQFGGVGCNFHEATTCESCAFQSGCKADDNGIACERFQFKSCLSCLHFQIKGNESFDGICNYTGKDIESGGPYAEDCNAEHYSPVVLSKEDWKEYAKQKGWD